MRLDPVSGLLRGARFVNSPNCDDRPPGAAVDVAVVHAISLPPGEFGGGHVERLFLNQLDPGAHPYFAQLDGVRVSAHFYIDRSGELVQYVPVTRRAWHAGVSCCEGRECVNDFSVGIELEGSDEVAFTDAQYECLAAVLRALMAACPGLTPQRVYGHSDVAPGRKTDPGPHFDWARLRRLCAA